MKVLSRWTRAFGMFWWDFLVGDTPELFVGMIVVVGGAFLVHRDRLVAVVLVPALAVLVLLASTFRGRRRS